MSIGKRLASLFRSNINSLFSDDEGSASTTPLEQMSDAELEAELARRQARREAASHAAQDAAGDPWESARYRSSGQRARRPSESFNARSRRHGTSRESRLAQLYAQLECPNGSDLETVRKHYRQMMRRYHPDVHTKDPERHKLATELSQKLTEVYNELRRELSGTARQR
ncbi:MAG: J domain-containing protein [Deltaproteobacteria bacterium]|nr:J domain-containing protein [Deltaproteobacteria bacterium]